MRKRGRRRSRLSAAAVQRLHQEFQGTTGELGPITAATRSAELVVREAALEAYGLDRADLDVMKATAPPRMPGAAAPAELRARDAAASSRPDLAAPPLHHRPAAPAE